MRLIIIILGLYVSDVFACIPCDEEATMYIINEAKPKFAKGYFGAQNIGHVRFKVEGYNTRDKKKITIISLNPPDIPKKPVMDMLYRSKLRTTERKRHHTACIDSFEVEAEFPLPQKILDHLEVEFEPLKIEINK